jgi:adenylate cyclase
VRHPPLILAVDDTPENLDILRMRLEAHDYAVVTAADGEEGLALARSLAPDLILLDVMMPKMDGIAVVRAIKGDGTLPFVPVILVTARADTRDVVAGLDAGADDYLTKPFEHSALLARVRAMLRLKALHDTVREQAATLERQARELASWNATLETRVAEQVAQIDRISRLRRFLPPQVADLVVAAGPGQDLLQSHRREVTIVFCDLRGFTAFAEIVEPEEVMTVLREYHEALGTRIVAFEGTLERFVGDGLLVILNDPLPQPDHSERALRMALEMRSAVSQLAVAWRARGHVLGFGIGIACGYTTLGSIGFEDRLDYAAIGTVPNLASRLCSEAKAGQILICQRTLSNVGERAETRLIGELPLKGFRRPVPAYELIAWRTAEVRSQHPGIEQRFHTAALMN